MEVGWGGIYSNLSMLKRIESRKRYQSKTKKIIKDKTILGFIIPKKNNGEQNNDNSQRKS